MPSPAGGFDSLSDPPEWAPVPADVAIYVPHRTLARSVSSVVDSQDEYLFTFDGTTRPTGEQVSALITDGVAWVSSRVTPTHPSSYNAAGVLAALWAAVHVERGWPKDDSSLERARDLEKTMAGMLDGLIASNTAAWLDDDDNPETPDLPALPVWSFPRADPRYDSAGYW